MKLEQEMKDLDRRISNIERYLKKQRDAEATMKRCTPRILEALHTKGFWSIDHERNDSK